MVKNRRKGKKGTAIPRGRFIQSAEEMDARNRALVKEGKKIRGVNSEDDDGASEFDSELAELIGMDDEEENLDDLDELTKKLRGIGSEVDNEKVNVMSLIDIDNPNKSRKGPAFIKLGDVASAGPQKLTRKEREHMEEIEQKRELARATAAGETAEAKADLARLEEVRAERARAKERREEEAKKKADLKAAARKRSETLANKGSKGKKGKKKKKGKR